MSFEVQILPTDRSRKKVHLSGFDFNHYYVYIKIGIKQIHITKYILCF